MMFLAPAARRLAQELGGQDARVDCSELLVFFDALPRQAALAIHEQRLCLSCLPPEGRLAPGRTMLGSQGVFVYALIPGGGNAAGLYGQEQFPATPAVIDDPAFWARDDIRKTRFDKLCFRDTPWLQPLEHGPCNETHRRTYLASSGEERTYG